MNSSDIIDEMVNGFVSLLRSLNEEGEDTPPQILTAYLMGFAATLKTLGFPDDAGRKLSLQLYDEIHRIGRQGCGKCEHCKAKKK